MKSLQMLVGKSLLVMSAVGIYFAAPVNGFAPPLNSALACIPMRPHVGAGPSKHLLRATLQTEEQKTESRTTGTVAIVLPSTGEAKSKYGTKSPIENPSHAEAAAHLAKKAHWFSDGTVEVTLVQASDATDLRGFDAVIALGLSTKPDMAAVRNIFEQRRSSGNGNLCQFTLDCAETLPSLVGPYDEASPSFQSTVLPWTKAATGFRLQQDMQGLFDRWTTDDFSVALMIFFNQFVAEVPWVKHSIDATWEKGPIRNAQEFYGMIAKCGDCIGDCLKDENCKKCIDALNAVDTRDQVASYRTIVSYESELLKEFSFCILTKNNVFGCDATIPQIPKVNPISSWRGGPLTTESAQALLVGHLDDEAAPTGSRRTDISWKVAAGANVAYDQFPSQNQIFYPAVSGRDMWYDPVFRVETIDGRVVWCKRHYKVRNGPVPGTFKLSVLDNGVTSNEFWTIVGVAEDLSWIIFHYAGAASAVGQRYLGGLLCTPDGTLPPESPEIWGALKSAGIEPWELHCVDNDPTSPGAILAGPPPLRFFRDDVLKAKQKKRDMTANGV
jgi:VDE lipocalin domain